MISFKPTRRLLITRMFMVMGFISLFGIITVTIYTQDLRILSFGVVSVTCFLGDYLLRIDRDN